MDQNFSYWSPRRPIAVFVFACLFFSRSAVATATDGKLPVVTQATIELPAVPFLASWCEGKNCEHQFTQQVICKATLYSDAVEHAKNGARSVGELNVGDVIETRVYYTKILSLGSYLPLEGEKKILVSRVDENSWLSFFGNAWDSENNVKDHATFPVTEAWALLKTKSGLIGFVRITGTGAKTCPFRSVAAATAKTKK